MILAILKAIAALPVILKQLKDFGDEIKEWNLEQKIKELDEAYQSAKLAKTTEERISALKKINSAWSS